MKAISWVNSEYIWNGIAIKKCKIIASSSWFSLSLKIAIKNNSIFFRALTNRRKTNHFPIQRETPSPADRRNVPIVIPSETLVRVGKISSLESFFFATSSSFSKRRALHLMGWNELFFFSKPSSSCCFRLRRHHRTSWSSGAFRRQERTSLLVGHNGAISECKTKINQNDKYDFWCLGKGFCAIFFCRVNWVWDVEAKAEINLWRNNLKRLLKGDF